MHVHVLALDGVFDLGLSAVLDAFHTANELAEISGFSGERFEVKIVGVTKSVKTSQGLTVPIRAIGSKAPDCVVIPAIGFKMPGPLEAALARPEIRDAAVVLRQWARKGVMMTAACIHPVLPTASADASMSRVTDTHRARIATPSRFAESTECLPNTLDWTPMVRLDCPSAAGAGEQLTAGDLAEIESAVSGIEVQGARYPAQLASRVGR